MQPPRGRQACACSADSCGGYLNAHVAIAKPDRCVPFRQGEWGLGFSRLAGHFPEHRLPASTLDEVPCLGRSIGAVRPNQPLQAPPNSASVAGRTAYCRLTGSSSRRARSARPPRDVNYVLNAMDSLEIPGLASTSSSLAETRSARTERANVVPVRARPMSPRLTVCCISSLAEAACAVAYGARRSGSLRDAERSRRDRGGAHLRERRIGAARKVKLPAHLRDRSPGHRRQQNSLSTPCSSSTR